MAQVLVVDDEPDLRQLIRSILEDDGHDVVDVGDGLAALEALAGRVPDLVVTDLSMPRMDGLELIDRLRSEGRTATIPILVVTGSAPAPVVADALLTKPFRPSELAAIARDLASRASQLYFATDGR